MNKMVYILYLCLGLQYDIKTMEKNPDTPTKQITVSPSGGRLFLDEQKNIPKKTIEITENSNENKTLLKYLRWTVNNIKQNASQYSTIPKEDTEKNIEKRIFDPNNPNDRIIYSLLYEMTNIESCGKIIMTKFSPNTKDYYLRHLLFTKEEDTHIMSLFYQNQNENKSFKPKKDTEHIFISWLAAINDEKYRTQLSTSLYTCLKHILDNIKSEKISLSFWTHKEKFNPHNNIAIQECFKKNEIEYTIQSEEKKLNEEKKKHTITLSGTKENFLECLKKNVTNYFFNKNN